MNSLKKILKGCLKNNKADQYELYSLYSPKMYGICLRYAGSTDEAQDILQEGFIRIFQHLPSFKGKGSFEGWIKRIMVNTAIEKYRERVYHLSVDSISENGNYFTDNHALELLEVNDVLNLFQELPDQYRLVFNLYAMEGYAHKEIAEMLNISESTSRSNLARARSLLQKKITRELVIIEKAI